MLAWIKKLDPVALAVARARRGLRARAGLTPRTVTLPDGLDVAYLDTEAEHPPLVLLHGIGASKDHWPRLAHRLNGRFRIIAPDLPGFGESAKPEDGDYSMGGQAEAVRAFLDRLGLPAVHLAGSSMGGRVAAEFTARYPERLHALWLLNPAGAEGEAVSEMVEGLFAGEGLPLFPQTAEEYAASVAFSMSRPPAIPGPALRVLAAESAESYEWHRHLFAQMSLEIAFGTPTEDLLRGCPVPTLVTWGEDDRIVHPSGAATIADAMPNATARLMPGIGHLPMLEDPDAAAADFLAFQDALEEAHRPARAA